MQTEMYMCLHLLLLEEGMMESLAASSFCSNNLEAWTVVLSATNNVISHSNDVLDGDPQDDLRVIVVNCVLLCPTLASDYLQGSSQRTYCCCRCV